MSIGRVTEVSGISCSTLAGLDHIHPGFLRELGNETVALLMAGCNRSLKVTMILGDASI